MKKNILITNDDGFDAPGIRAIAKVLSEYFNIYIVAPHKERSACSSSMTIGNSIIVYKHKDCEPFLKECYSISGTPVDCVKLALDKLINVPISFVVSGINRGINTGIDIHYSGTVGAALEAYMMGFRAIAFSVDVDNGEPDYNKTAKLCMIPFKHIMDLPEKKYLFNVNIPSNTTNSQPSIKYTRLNWFGYEDNYHLQNVSDDEKMIYTVKGKRVRIENAPDSDYITIKNGDISITPLKMDLTHYDHIEKFSGYSISQLEE